MPADRRWRVAFTTPAPRKASATEEQKTQVEAALRLDPKIAALIDGGREDSPPGILYVLSNKRGRDDVSVRVVLSSFRNAGDVAVSPSPDALTLLRAVIEEHAGGWLPNAQQDLAIEPTRGSATLRAARARRMEEIARALQERLLGASSP